MTSLKSLNPVPSLKVTDRTWFFIIVSLVIAIIARKRPGDMALHSVGMVA